MGEVFVKVESLINKTIQRPDEEIEQEILSYTNSFEGMIAFLQVIKKGRSRVVRQGGAIYFVQSLGNNKWQEIEEEEQEIVRQMLLEILTRDLDKLVLHTLLEGIIFVFAHSPREADGEGWPELIQLIVEAASENTFLSAKLLSGIGWFFTENTLEEHADLWVNIAFTGLQSDDVDTVIPALGVYHILASKHEILPDIEGVSITPLVLELAGSSLDIFEGEDLANFWNSLSDSFEDVGEDLPEEVLVQLFEIILTLGNTDAEPYSRFCIVNSMVELLRYMPVDSLPAFLEMCCKIRAAILEADGNIEGSELSHFEVISETFDHNEVYPFIWGLCQEAMQSDDVHLQASGLLICYQILSCFGDCAYRDAPEITSMIEEALTSDIEIIGKAALIVTQAFSNGDEYMAQYSAKFLPLLLQLLGNDDRDIRQTAFTGVTNIVDTIDAQIDIDIFDEYMALLPKMQENDELYLFVQLMTGMVRVSELDDERLDAVMSLYMEIMDIENTENLEEKAAGLELAAAIVQQDDAQLDDIMTAAFPVFELLWEQEGDEENGHPAETCMNFIGNISRIVRENIMEVLGEPISAMLTLLEEEDPEVPDSLDDKMICCLVQNCSVVAKYADVETRAGILERLYPKIIRGFKSGCVSAENPFTQESSKAARRLAPFLPQDSILELFREHLKIAKEENVLEVVDEYMASIAKLVRHAGDEIKDDVLTETINFINYVREGEIELMKSIPLIEWPLRAHIIGNFGRVISACFKHKIANADEISTYLLEWLSESDCELELFDIIGTLSDALEYDSVSPELHGPILEVVVSKIPMASEPNLMQNIVYLMNVLVQNDADMISGVMDLMETFEDWRSKAEENKYGWEDIHANIASLYLQIAKSSAEFPVELTCAAIAVFPPSDIEESNSMAKAMIAIAGNDPSEDVITQMALAIARFVTRDEGSQAKAGIEEEVLQGMYHIFREAFAVGTIASQLTTLYGRQRTKQSKIQAILESE